MQQCVLITWLCAICMVVSSCGPKKHQIITQPVVIEGISEQRPVDPFVALSVDDIRKNKELYDNRSNENTVHDRHILADDYEARLIDVSIPCGSRLLDQYASAINNNQELVLGYASSLSLSEIELFFIDNMERLGWHCTCHVHGREQLLVFEKPGRVCAITLCAMVDRDDTQSALTKMVLFYTKK